MAILDSVTKSLRYREMISAFKNNFGSNLTGMSCLNVGGGYGYAHDILSDLGLIVTTCDISGNCYYCDLNKKLSFQDNAFDFVVCLAVLEHLDDWQNGLEELKRVCSKGVIATTPSIYGKPVLDALAVLRLVNKEHIDDHKHYLTKNEIEEHGFNHKYFQFKLNQIALYDKRIK